MTKNVNLRLDTEKDSDLLEAMEHSLISNPQLFKLLARVALSNKEALSLQGMFDNGYFNDDNSNKTIKNDTKVSKPVQKDTKQNESIQKDTIQNDTKQDKPKQEDTKVSETKQNDTNQEEDLGAGLFKGLGK